MFEILTTLLCPTLTRSAANIFFVVIKTPFLWEYVHLSSEKYTVWQESLAGRKFGKFGKSSAIFAKLKPSNPLADLFIH